MGLKKPHLQWNSLCASLLCCLTGKYLLVSGLNSNLSKKYCVAHVPIVPQCNIYKRGGVRKRQSPSSCAGWNSQRASSNGCFTTLLLHVLPNAAASSPPVPSHHLSQLTLLLSGKINSYSREETSLEFHFLPPGSYLKLHAPGSLPSNPFLNIIVCFRIRRITMISITVGKSNPKRRGELMRLDRGLGGWKGGPRRD